MSIDLPLGAEFEAVGLDKLESALDNTGSIFIRFLRDESASASVEPPETSEEQEEDLPEEEIVDEVTEEDTATVIQEDTLLISEPLLVDIYADTLSLQTDSLQSDSTLSESSI